MLIEDHKLNPGWHGMSPNHGGALIKPSLLVMHFTASGGSGPEDDAKYFMTPAAKASAHVIIGRDGAVRQVVPFNVKAWHAGKSIWRGRPNCNDYSIGIEVDNWGKLIRTADGQVRSWTGKEIDPALAVALTHKHESTPCLWERYNAVQIEALAALTRLILDTYPSIAEIVGHEDIAPGRKVDPGPAFPMSRFVSLVEGRGDQAEVFRTVIVNRLNARGGPGLNYELLGRFKEGTRVKVVYDAPGEWCQVRGKLTNGTEVTAWVVDQHLR